MGGVEEFDYKLNPNQRESVTCETHTGSASARVQYADVTPYSQACLGITWHLASCTPDMPDMPELRQVGTTTTRFTLCRLMSYTHSLPQTNPII